MYRPVFSLVFLLGLLPGVLSAGECLTNVLLVSLEKYELAPLDYAFDDVGKLATVFMDRCNCVTRAVIDTDADGSDTSAARHKASIMKKVEQWAARMELEDTAILYLAGHGVRDSHGRLYLAMINFDGKNFAEAAIPMAWFRENVAACPAQCKLLLLDTCYAGTSRSGQERASAKDMADAFSGLENVTTIASSKAGQRSWLWAEKGHSLFTYWLIQALKGHADADQDQIITCRELVDYLEENVSWIAEMVLEERQTPIALNPEQIRDRFGLPLKAIPLARLIDDMAEQLDVRMRVEKLSMVAVAEFVTGHTGKVIEAKYGALPGFVAEELRCRLARKRRGAYRVLSEDAVREMLQDRDLAPSELGTSKTKGLAVEGQQVPSIVSGRLALQGTANVTLRASLLETDWSSEVGSVGGAAMMSESELAMTEISVVMPGAASGDVKKRPRPPGRPKPPRQSGKVKPPAPRPTLPGQSGRVNANDSNPQGSSIAAMREEAKGPHPLKDDDGEFKVWFLKRPIGSEDYGYVDVVFDGNKCYLPLDRGEEFAIQVHNQSGSPVFMRALVDGLNTISERRPVVEKGIEVIPSDQPKGTFCIAPRVSLEHARAWHLDDEPAGLSGFYDANREKDTLRRFRIVDADESIAARSGYTEQIGLITIALYRPVVKRSLERRGDRVGVGWGEEEAVHLEYYEGDEVPGKLLAVYSIRYLTPEALAKVLKK